MAEPIVTSVTEIGQEISWTVDFHVDIQNLRHTNSTKVETISLLVEEEARIQTDSRELADA